MSEISVADAGARFLSAIEGEARKARQQEVNRFVRWCGGERAMGALTAALVGSYAESMAAAPEKLEPIKEFLAYAKKQGLTQTNLAPHLRLKKSPQKTNTRSVSAKATQLTTEGHAKLEEELATLKAERVRVAEELRLAMADKDFSENSPLDAARNRQGHLEARIREVESALRTAAIFVKGDRPHVKIGMGSRVHLLDLASGQRREYTLVSPREASLAQGKLSLASPTGQALLERAQGETVEVTAPAGTLRYLIEGVTS